MCVLTSVVEDVFILQIEVQDLETVVTGLKAQIKELKNKV
jgi:hypothetical protein